VSYDTDIIAGMSEAEKLWTIDELAAQVALALATDYAGAPNGRIRGVPDLRTIRYYTTLGLLDRPASMRGRTALYGRKHLLQLVAIKRLQAQGLTLVEIQQRLLGKTEEELAGLAQMPSSSASAFRQPPTQRVSFWKQSPAKIRDLDNGLTSPGDGEGVLPLEASGLSSDSADLTLASEPFTEGSSAQARHRVTASQHDQSGSNSPGCNKRLSPRVDQPAGDKPDILQGVALRNGVTLLLAPLRSLTADDVQAIQTAAEPLLKYLEKRFLIPVFRKDEP
jgi:DNA-binding transcriptional MerR regulator